MMQTVEAAIVKKPLIWKLQVRWYRKLSKDILEIFLSAGPEVAVEVS